MQALVPMEKRKAECVASSKMEVRLKLDDAGTLSLPDGQKDEGIKPLTNETQELSKVRVTTEEVCVGQDGVSPYHGYCCDT